MNVKCMIYLSLMSYAMVAQALSFSKTKDEEIAEFVETFHAKHPEKRKEDLYAQIENYGVGPQFFPISEIICEESETDDQNTLEMSILAQDALDSFNQLKIMMGIPEEVELWIENKHINKAAHYNDAYRRIEILSTFFQYPPSARLFILIHELTHVQQHIKEGLVLFIEKKKNKSGNFEHERQADTAAVQAVSCPICIQIVEDNIFLGESSKQKDHFQVDRNAQGYLSSAQIAEYKRSKNLVDICPVHRAQNEANQKLVASMSQKIEQKETFFEWLFESHKKQAEKEKQSELREKLDTQSSKFIRDRLSCVKIE